MTEGGRGNALAHENAFRMSVIAMCVVDPDAPVLMRIVATNSAFDRRVGAPSGGSILALFVSDEERASAEATLATLGAPSGEVERVVIRGRCETSSGPRILSWSCRAVDGLIFAELDDATERATLECELDALLRALPDIYFRLDASGRIVAFYAAREGELHVPPERFIGRRPHDLVPPEVAPLIASAVERVRSERAPVQIEYALSTPSGDDQFEAYLVTCGENEVTALIRNTTARRRAEAALRVSEERLRATQKLDAIGRLAGGVAHDFNNLLGVILGRLALLGHTRELGASDREHVDEALDAAKHAASLTRQLLALGRRQAMEPKVFDLNAALEPMLDMLRRIVGEHVELVLALSETPCPIDSDPVQIEQIVLNLALNARHAMPNGGKLVVSTVETVLDERAARTRDAAPGTYVTLTVTDTGHGMTDEVKAHLFEPFFTTKPHGEGTGLGLATVYGIVKQCGGHLVVRSDVGVGSSFELSFPRARV